MSEHNPKRLRRKPLQVYLSEAEEEALDYLTRAQKCSRSELVRALIHSARLSRVTSQKTPQTRDPRQLEIARAEAAIRRPGRLRP
jgi:hypothetical protein